MRKIFYLVALIFISVPAISQNMVPNGNFEQYTTCSASIDSCIGWHQYTLGTSDYYCSASYLNGFGYQVPASGNAYAGFVTYTAGGGNYKEYISRAITSLKPGSKYMYVLGCYL